MQKFERIAWSPARLALVGVVGVLVALAFWSPAGAHDGSTTHLWNSHIKAMAEPGTINAAANPVHWTKLKGVPAGIADGSDNNTPVVGYGLKYGGFGILTIDSDKTQRRVEGTCPSGQAIRSIGEVGSVACSAGPLSLSATSADSGIICNDGYCTEGSLALPAGAYLITAKIGVSQQGDDEILRVRCRLSAGGEMDESFVNLLGVGTFNGDTVIPLQVIATLSSPGDALLTCRDFDVGDVKGRNVSLIAVRVSG